MYSIPTSRNETQLFKQSGLRVLRHGRQVKLWKEALQLTNRVEPPPRYVASFIGSGSERSVTGAHVCLA